MLEFFSLFAGNVWILTAQMAPYLILGFLMSGLFFWLIQPETVGRLLGKPNLSSVIKSCLVGIPMPLCSCSVIPVAASLKKNGASRGATAAFISATPQTGVDSIFATYSLMGGLFTVMRIVVALISGIVTGLLIELFCGRKKQLSEIPIETVKKTCCSTPALQRPGLIQSLKYGFLKLPSELSTALIVGLILAGLITTLLPPNWFEGSFSSGSAAFLIVTLIGLPLYICATASIPMAYALIAAGLSPGAALVFLIVGPATNTATVVTLWKILGHKATGIYLTSLTAIAWISGWILNAGFDLVIVDASIHSKHDALPTSLWQHVCGLALVAILTIGLSRRKRQNGQKESCCK